MNHLSKRLTSIEDRVLGKPFILYLKDGTISRLPSKNFLSMFCDALSGKNPELTARFDNAVDSEGIGRMLELFRSIRKGPIPRGKYLDDDEE